MEVRFNLLSAENLATSQWDGSFDLQTLEVESHRFIGQLRDTKVDKCIIDLRNAEFEMDYIDGKNVIQKIAESLELEEAMRIVLITETPRTTIFAILLMQFLDQSIHFASLCSTVEYAIPLLDIRKSEKEIREKLHRNGTARNSDLITKKETTS